MKHFFLFLVSAVSVGACLAQGDKAPDPKLLFSVIKNNPATAVKNQSATGTCWSFSTTAQVESQAIKNKLGEFDLSEMFTVRNIYIEKAKNYVLRQGHTQFGEGALGHDQINAIGKYGAIPESVYSGLINGNKAHDHKKLFKDLKQYLETLIAKTPLPQDWLAGYTKILDAALGAPPEQFDYKGKTYTPLTFAREVLQFNSNDYIALTSFSHHPYYQPFVLEVPDNFSSGAYVNLPIGELIQITKDVINNGYTITWDADVSNKGFMANKGIAGLYDTSINAYRKPNGKKAMYESKKGTGGVPAATPDAAFNSSASGNGKVEEGLAEDLEWDADLRQALFENLVTQDDHLMQITGIEMSKSGKTFFIVKNSWGEIGPDKGYIHVSEPYFAINTISLIVPKAALTSSQLERLKGR